MIIAIVSLLSVLTYMHTSSFDKLFLHLHKDFTRFGFSVFSSSLASFFAAFGFSTFSGSLTEVAMAASTALSRASSETSLATS